MTFLQMYTELSDRLGAYDSAVSSDLTKLKRWINMAQQYICGKHIWPFMLAAEIVQTIPDVTTGTVAVSAAGTTLTFTSGPAASVANRYIKFTTSNDWYKITAHIAASTSATIDPAYVGTSNLTAGTFTIRKLHYATATPLLQIMDMKQLATPVRIISQSPRDTDYFLPLYYDAGVPYYYTMSTPNSSGTPQFSLLPAPSSILNIMVRGLQKLTDLSADGDISVIPAPWHDAVVNIAAFYGFQSLDDTRATTEFQVGEARIEDMSRTYSHDLGRHRIMKSFGENSDYGIEFALPSNFGPWVP